MVLRRQAPEIKEGEKEEVGESETHLITITMTDRKGWVAQNTLYYYGD